MTFLVREIPVLEDSQRVHGSYNDSIVFIVIGCDSVTFCPPFP
jgi:hypothetical protein